MATSMRGVICGVENVCVFTNHGTVWKKKTIYLVDVLKAKFGLYIPKSLGIDLLEVMQNEGENKPLVCRLCLISCECNFEGVEAVIIQMLKRLGLDQELDITEKHVICRICSENLQKCFDFKAVCQHTEYGIDSFRSNENNVKVDLREVYLRKNENKNVTMSDCHTICRLCMEVAETGHYMALNDEAKDIILAKIILGKCFSEMDVDVTEDPIICTRCIESLRSYFSFINNCLDVADKIKYYEIEESYNKPQMGSNYVLQIKTEDKSNYKSDYACGDTQKNLNGNGLYDDVIQLEYHLQDGSQVLHLKHELNADEDVSDNVEKMSSSMQFTMADMLYCKSGYIDVNVVKKCNDNEQYGETELKSDNFTEPDSREFNFKVEDIDIRTEDEDTARFQGNIRIPEDGEICTDVHENISDITTYSCEECTYKTNLKSNFKKHVLIHKNVSELTMYSCEICSHKDKRKDNFKRHMLIHNSGSKATSVSCKICAYTPKQKGKLKNHMLIHQDPSKVIMYYCDACTFKTRHKSSLKHHVLIHRSTSGAYSCEICGYKGRRKADLQRHSLIHKNASEVTAYQCDVCTFKTRHKGVLKRHAVVHKSASEVRMYQCDLCAFKTKHRRSLNQHTLIKHMYL